MDLNPADALSDDPHAPKPFTSDEVGRWELMHNGPVLMGIKDRLAQTTVERETLLVALGEADQHFADLEKNLADVTAERDALAAHVLELEKAASGGSPVPS